MLLAAQIAGAPAGFRALGFLSAYNRTMQLATEGNALALGLLKACYEWVLKQGRDQSFAGTWVTEGIPVVNLRTLSARGILEKVASTRRGRRADYRLIDPDGVGQALRTLRLV